MDKLYKDLIESNWSLTDIEEAKTELLFDLFMEDGKGEEEKKQDALSFFGTFMSPEDIARAKGDTD